MIQRKHVMAEKECAAWLKTVQRNTCSILCLATQIGSTHRASSRSHSCFRSGSKRVNLALSEPHSRRYPAPNWSLRPTNAPCLTSQQELWSGFSNVTSAPQWSHSSSNRLIKLWSMAYRAHAWSSARRSRSRGRGIDFTKSLKQRDMPTPNISFMNKEPFRV